MNLTDPGFIKALLAEHGFSFAKSMGQNFLIDAAVPERIAEGCGAGSEDAVLEIGPGIGTLTKELALRAGRVLSVELDERLRPILRVTLAEYENTRVEFGDALKLDLPGLCRAEAPEARWRVCANLPYNVTSPLLTKLLSCGFFESVTVMIQREVADRICAAPGTADYGSLTVMAQVYARPEKLFDVTPDCFMPQPKVTSTVISLVRREEPLVAEEDADWYFKVVRAAFGQRRKALPNALSAGLQEISKQEAAEALEAMGLKADIRGERLSPEEFKELAEKLKK